MDGSGIRHVLIGVAAAAAAILLAIAWGAPLEAALIALAGGAAAALLLRPRDAGRRPLPPLEAEPAPMPQRDAFDLLEVVDDPVLIVADRRILYANPAARSLLGENIEGVDVRLAIRHPAAAERLIDRSPADAAERVTRTDLVGLGDPDRRWEMTTTLLGDGSRLVRLIDRSEAHASEQMRVDFVANASHELRTPLATLLGFLETLQDEQAAGDAKTRSRFVKIMFDEARRMHRLVDDLISLSRIEAERFSVPRDPVDLLSVVEEVRSGLAPMIENKGATLIIDQKGSLPVAPGDRTQLVQLVQNLVVNALKYGRPDSEVRVRFDDAGADMLRMSIIDRGEGIPPEHLPRLTERFYRVDPGRSRAIGGTGLGLAIVKHIVGRHRGRLDIRSTPGEGTSVRVYLPRAVTNR